MTAGNVPDPIPIRAWMAGHPVPDLERLPRERWEEALRQIPRFVRSRAIFTAEERWGEAGKLVSEIESDEDERRIAADARVAFPPPVPGRGATPAPRARGGRQVNFRLSPADHQRLADAAELLGLKVAQLARLLALRGVAQILEEARGGAPTEPR